METLITAVIILASILLVFVVYVQNPKGGGLSSDFGAAQQIGGVQKTNDFIDKATWSLAFIVGALSIWLTMMTKSPAIEKPVQEDQQEQNDQQNPGGQNPNGNQPG